MPQDPYRFFRIEARELIDGLDQGILALEQGVPARQPVGVMLRLAHTLKGAARVVRQTDIADTAHRVEDLLVPFRESEAQVQPDDCAALRALVQAMTARLRAIDDPAAAIPPAPPTGPSAPRPSPAARPSPPAPGTGAGPGTEPGTGGETGTGEPLRTLRIGIDDLDGILGGVAQAGVSLETLGRSAAAIRESLALADSLAAALAPDRDGDGRGPDSSTARVRALAGRLRDALRGLRDDLGQAVERTSRDLGRATDAVRRLRLIPAATIVPALERTVQDAAEQLGKPVRFTAGGGEVLVDADVLDGVRDALVQVVRNAVAHGLESAQDRAAAGKPAAGLVELRIERRGHRVVFRCRDDGRGLDLAAIRAAALRRDPSRPVETVAAMTLDEAVTLVFRGGLSTARSVTALAGRGVGLDLVHDTVQRLKGGLTASTEAGRGTVVEIGVPVSLASLTVLQVAAGPFTVSIPLDAVRRAAKGIAGDTASPLPGNALLIDGEALPCLHLPTLLWPDGGAPSPDAAFPDAPFPDAAFPDAPAAAPTLLVVEAHGARAAVGVDRLLGAGTVVMRRLPAACGSVPWVAGASLDADGTPRLVLDPAGLVAMARDGRGVPPPARPTERRRLLVVDDSLTTRMLERSILETAGYDVDLASSGEEGLDKARAGGHALYVVDVEMPGIDGYEFIRRIRRDPALCHVPAIMVTSLSSDRDRRTAEEAGAQDYIVKSEFDEGRLLLRIRQLIGAPAGDRPISGQPAGNRPNGPQVEQAWQSSAP
ncbi:two-component system chemotaxis sensor kinase CheA [Azospirillum agricola]|uniref:hybrid sensor histidine kinase/response regulator n=1 Tax=Azospirillum agricola TaxID=1720247 RepID=UPI001AEAF3F9|nr:response regulator [Azospirillum agricola]MBP2227892.1 two-component system chemotaxis sensor kinase CheA [Azospirillum agricola]